ncbi:MAG TPA: MarR family transcriptional regulator [Lachnospiraceae bacterium]|nr:MarR family transcriptional regulator [Lachnospiraceae bacterium]
MRDYSKSSELMERIIHKYNQTENKLRNYGTGILLTRTEIHTIDLIGNNEGINITQLALKQGITKGAVSQMIYKLVNKGLVTKHVSPDSDTEVRMELTEEGITAYQAHQRFHMETNEEFFQLLQNMPDETYDQMITVLMEFERMIDKKLAKKDSEC